MFLSQGLMLYDVVWQAGEEKATADRPAAKEVVAMGHGPEFYRICVAQDEETSSTTATTVPGGSEDQIAAGVGQHTVTPQECAALYDSLHDRMAAFIAENGNLTRY